MSDVRTSLDIDGGVVVGHDGSEHADKAVLKAARWAGRAGLPLHIVRVWTMSSAPRPKTWSPGYVPPMTDFEEAVRDALAADVGRLTLPPESPEPQFHTLHGAPGRRMVEATEKADLMVVAKRGRGGFLGMVLGSTTQQVVQYGKCPVMVIPAVRLDDEPAEPDHALDPRV